MTIEGDVDAPPDGTGDAPAALHSPIMTETTIETPTFRHFIAGEWCESTSGATFESRNPADARDVIGRFQQGTAADVAMAVKAAETARPMWQRTPAPKRGEILYAFGALMAEHKERLARAMTREMGKVLVGGPRRRPGRHRHRLPDGRRGPPDVRRHRPVASCPTSGR